MLTELVLASGNQGKIAEFQRLLEGLDIQVHSMKAYPEIGEIIEDGASFAENALIKARAVCKATGKAALADDLGPDGGCVGRRTGYLFSTVCR